MPEPRMAATHRVLSLRLPCLLVGTVHGVGGSWYLLRLLGSPGVIGNPSDVKLQHLAVFVAPTLLLCGVIAACRNQKGALFGAFLYLAGIALGTAASIPWIRPNMPLGWRYPAVGGSDLGEMFYLTWFVLFGMGLTLAGVSIAFGIAKMFKRRKGPNECLNCRYDIGSASIPRCSECGQLRGTPLPLGCADRLLPRSRTFTAILIVGIIVIGAVGLWRNTVPSARFLSAFESSATLEVTGTGCVVTSTSGKQLHALDVAWWLPDTDSSQEGIAVRYVPRTTGRRGRIVVTRSILIPWTYGLSQLGEKRLCDYGDHLRCDLTEAQTDLVIARQSIPTTLIQHLQQAARHSKWYRGDQLHETEGVIDPTQFFP